MKAKKTPLHYIRCRMIERQSKGKLYNYELQCSLPISVAQKELLDRMCEYYEDVTLPDVVFFALQLLMAKAEDNMGDGKIGDGDKPDMDWELGEGYSLFPEFSL